MLLFEMIDYITRELTGSGIAPPESSAMARMLLAHKLAIGLPQLPFHHHAKMDIGDISGDLARLKSGEPLQYVTGETEFMGLPLYCSPAALIPRGDSEAIVETAVSLMRDLPAPLIADICTGGGAFALALAHLLPQARLWAVDISPPALDLAARNAAHLRLSHRIEFLAGDLLRPLADKGLYFDLIISNPPYVPSAQLEHLPPQVKNEPALALDGGTDGLCFYRRLAADAGPFLHSDGLLLMEHGADQTESVAQIMRSAGFVPLKVICDYAHRERGTLVKRAF